MVRVRIILCVIGGILMLLSILIPVFYRRISFGKHSEEIIYWMFGYYQKMSSQEESGFYKEKFDLLGIICLVIIVVGSIISLATSSHESKAPLVGGLIGLFGMLFYVFGVYFRFYGFSPISLRIEDYVPYFGFYVCIGGSILSMIGAFLKN